MIVMKVTVVKWFKIIKLKIHIEILREHFTPLTRSILLRLVCGQRGRTDLDLTFPPFVVTNRRFDRSSLEIIAVITHQVQAASRHRQLKWSIRYGKKKIKIKEIAIFEIIILYRQKVYAGNCSPSVRCWGHSEMGNPNGL